MATPIPPVLRALIIDDEPISRTVIRRLLERFCPSVQVAGEAESAATGRALIAAEDPDLVFLDIEMPFGSGFAVLESFPARRFEVIVVTAHERHALRAVGHGPLEYLLKPIDIGELMGAVGRAAERKTRTTSHSP